MGSRMLYSAPMDLRVKRTRAGAKLPARQSYDASGLDLYAALEGHPDATWGRDDEGEPTRCVLLPPWSWRVIPVGVAMVIPVGFEGQVRPRSGLGRYHGVRVELGTIDADYRGELTAVTWNLSGTAYTVLEGDRVCQLVIAPVERPRVLEVDELPPTTRGGNGFGSTGR